MSTNPLPKRLIEVDLPIKRISEHARREKSIRHGHISTLHIWWARRPLAACRAVICAALWPDPADPHCPQSFRNEAARVINLFAAKASSSKELSQRCSQDTWAKWQTLTKTGGIDPTKEPHWNVLRFALLDFIADFANWDSSTVSEYLETTRALTHAAHEALGGPPGTKPLVVDPFAGGGSIPLEALRIGADTFASDLNPVAVLLNKFVLEHMPKYGERLAELLLEYGRRIRAKAKEELEPFYLNDEVNGNPIAYLWARTVLSEAPGGKHPPIEVPLLRSMWLSKRKDFLRALRWVRNSEGKVQTETVSIKQGGDTITVQRPLLEVFSPKRMDEVESGAVKGGAATCPVTGFTTSASRVKEQLKLHHGGAQNSRLYALYVERSEGRDFRIATKADESVYEAAVQVAQTVNGNDPAGFPSEKINPKRPYKNTRGLSAVTRIGCSRFCDLYNPRQSLSIYTFYKVMNELAAADLSSDKDYSGAIQTALAFAVNRGVAQNTSLSRWDATRLTIKGAFSKQALAVVWDFAEANPFSGATADWDGAIEWITKFIEANAAVRSKGTVLRASATRIPLPADSAAALITDPPYFAAIPYGDLSDFFYVWLRRGLSHTYPDLLHDSLTDKEDELIVTNAQQAKGDRPKDELFFKGGMTEALQSARTVVQGDGIGVVVYAEGTTAGWEAILGAIIDSQWTVTSSWPIDTEMENRTRAHGAASLQSSIHIVCRPQKDLQKGDGAVGDWRDVLSELPTRIHDWMPRLANEGIVGADAIFACLGPALEIFSRYARVEKASGEVVELHEYLEHVWAAVSKEALAMVFKGADASGLEEDARLTAMWLWTLSASQNAEKPTDESLGDEDEDDEDEDSDPDEQSTIVAKPKGYVLEYDAARKIAQGLGAHLGALTSLIEVKGKVARLLPVAERTRRLFGNEDSAADKLTRKKKSSQLKLGFEEELAQAEETGTWGSKGGPELGTTVLDRVHQAMILFGANRGEALRRFLVDDAVGRDERFWRLAQVLSYLYPKSSDEKRWIDGVLGRKKGMGL